MSPNSPAASVSLLQSLQKQLVLMTSHSWMDCFQKIPALPGKGSKQDHVIERDKNYIENIKV